MKKVMVGISGGVDSCVSAYLLKQKGYDVLGVTLKLLDNLETNKMIEDAKKICESINIKHLVLDYTKEFKEEVIDKFINDYQNGLTPNPCIICNRKFKFGRLFLKGKELGYDYIATGHYADICSGNLLKIDNTKDQSYFLYNIKKEVLEHIIFPLNSFHDKDEIRQIANDNHFFVSNKKDSQDICFIPDNDYIKFLELYIPKQNGIIRNIDGQILGKHDGIYKYTIGQRKGLNIAYKYPLYVVDIDVLKNEVIVGKNSDLYNDLLVAKDINILSEDIEGTVFAKVRSRGELYKATSKIIDNKLYIQFDYPIRAITKGQSVVLYKDNICLGGGIIEKIGNTKENTLQNLS